MKSSLFLTTLAYYNAYAFPGVDKLLHEFARRQDAPQSRQMIGDLVKGATTEVGRRVRDCLLGDESCEVTRPLNSMACRRDTCCVWDYIQSDLTEILIENDGTCNRLARQAVRLGFHDAGAWSQTSRTGGADGSLLLSSNEMSQSINNGMQDIRDVGLEILDRYQGFGISAGDLVQFMHNVAVVVCPLGPRILTFIGRTDNDESPAGLLPTNNLSADRMIEVFANKTFGTRDLVAVVGAHTTAGQFFVDTNRAGAPLDTTPGVWDINYYREVLTDSPPSNVFRLHGDDGMARSVELNTFFQTYAVWGNSSGPLFVFVITYYVRAYVRLSLLGVNNINDLIDCTAVLPSAVTSSTTRPNNSDSDSGNAAYMVVKTTYVFPVIDCRSR
ncbi:ligninase H2 precursor [Fusarium flagelliforme]|uniref:ligninase H2 precursor n=1 Tax=Fusarium flagelliforme TaxID=2675880 RepID=UPI001E8D36F5|nr:ligninase H2 precursor [Fusarium flagelliforme]KAH7169655.1 ligninase H2 precursor [Fusarium flagelliforme]